MPPISRLVLAGRCRLQEYYDLKLSLKPSKSLYFSVGGLGDSGVNPFAELAKRFYLRLDPQNPLPSLTIRAKSLLN